MDFYGGTIAGEGVRRRKRSARKAAGGKKKKMSEYNKFVKHYMLQGSTMAQAAALWRKYKRTKAAM